MNRRQMLGLTSGFILGGVVPLSAQTNEISPWFILEEELNIRIINPNITNKKKPVETNRFGLPINPDGEKLVRKAEAVYPTNLPTLAVNGGKTLWYEDNEGSPFNITRGAVNYFFAQTNVVKNSRAKYLVSIETFEAVTNKHTKEGSENKVEAESNEVTEITLNLSYSYYCGNLCAYGFDFKKRVYFDKKGEIVALFMPYRNITIS